MSVIDGVLQMADTIQCRALNKKGDQCGIMTANPTGVCHKHIRKRSDIITGAAIGAIAVVGASMITLMSNVFTVTYVPTSPHIASVTPTPIMPSQAIDIRGDYLGEDGLIVLNQFTFTADDCELWSQSHIRLVMPTALAAGEAVLLVQTEGAAITTTVDISDPRAPDMHRLRVAGYGLRDGDSGVVDSNGTEQLFASATPKLNRSLDSYTVFWYANRSPLAREVIYAMRASIRADVIVHFELFRANDTTHILRISVAANEPFRLPIELQPSGPWYEFEYQLQAISEESAAEPLDYLAKLLCLLGKMKQYAMGDFGEEAIATLLEGETVSFVARYFAGVSCYMNGQDKKAIEFFESALHDASDMATARILNDYAAAFSRLHSTEGDVVAKTLAIYDRAIAADPQFWMPYHGKAYYYSIMGQHNKAVAFLEQAELKAREPREENMQLRAEIYRRQGKMEEYLRIAEQAREGWPNLDNTRLLAGALFFNGRVGRALEMYTAILNERPRDTESLVMRVTLFMDSQNHAAALIDLQELLADSPTYADGWHNKGVCHRESGESEQAAAAFLRAAALSPKWEVNWMEAIAAKLALGRVEDARAILEAATKHIPELRNEVAGDSRFRALKQD